ncbi:MAG: ABC transporter permease [Chloroflexota bacterium]|jgi:peptide/nickel transport system permease protein
MSATSPVEPFDRPIEAQEPPIEAPRWVLLRALFDSPVTIFAVVVIVIVLLMAIFGEMIAPYGANEINVMNQLQPPNVEHWFGTDELGRDVFSRVIIAARVSVQVSIVSVAIALVLGVTIGLLSGFFGSWADIIGMRAMDVMFAFPVVLLALAIVAMLGPGIVPAMIAIGVVYTPYFARITRASVLSVREETYIRAARSIGAGNTRILRLHVLPNVMAPIIVQTSLSLAFAILTEAALSFLGLGVQPPQPSWGRMLFDGRGFLSEAWWMAVFPGLAIFLTVLALNLVGDAMRDALDPRQRSAIEARSGNL